MKFDLKDGFLFHFTGKIPQAEEAKQISESFRLTSIETGGFFFLAPDCLADIKTFRNQQ